MITLTHHVAGGYTYGYKKDKKVPKAQPCPHSKGIYQRYAISLISQFVGLLKLIECHADALMALEGLPPWIRDQVDLPLSPLGLSKVSNSHAKARLKSWTMSNRRKRSVRGAIRCLEAMHRKECLSFGTLTLPPEFAYIFDAKSWSRAIHIWKESMRRRFKAAGMDFDYIGVYEIHPDRSLTNGFPILHAHVVFAGRLPYRPWVVSTSELTDIWRAACCSALGNDHPTAQWDAATNVVQVKKSVSAYLGKYLSKKAHAELTDFSSIEYQPWLPRNWAFIAAKVLKVLSSSTVKLFGHAASSLIDWLLEQAKLEGWRHETTTLKDLDGREYVIGGWIGAPHYPPIQLSREASPPLFAA